MKRIIKFGEYFISPLLVLAAWTVIALNDETRLFLPSPLETFLKFQAVVQTLQYYNDIFYTVAQALIAFCISVLIGVPVGLLISSSKKVSRMTEPIVEFARSIPSTSIFPLFLIIFGIGFNSRILTASFVTVWIIIINTIYGVKHATKSRIKSATLLGASRIELFLHVTIFEATPFILSAFRLSISLSLVIIIVTEMLVGPRFGMGVRIFELQQYYKVPELYVYLITIGFIGYFFNRTFMLFENRTVHWTDK